MNAMDNYTTEDDDRTNYCYHSLINLNGLSVSRRRIQQVALKFPHLGLQYSPHQDSVSLLCYRGRDDGEVLAALAELAPVLPPTVCYRVKAVCQQDALDYGYLLYAGSIYRLENLAHPTRPRRLLIEQHIAA